MSHLDKGYLLKLLNLAERQNSYSKGISIFYRNKSSTYFEDVERNGNVLPTLTKDNGGDGRSPINGKLKGVFLDTTVRNGSISDKSPFGCHRIQFPIAGLFDKQSNLYFTDFYCKIPRRRRRRNKFRTSTSNHYVTLVLSKRGSEADRFCKENLVKLNPNTNPFLRRCDIEGKEPEFTTVAQIGTSSSLHVEVFYTEEIRINDLKEKFGDERVKRTITGTIGQGSSTFGGMPKDTSCSACNPASNTSDRPPDYVLSPEDDPEDDELGATIVENDQVRTPNGSPREQEEETPAESHAVPNVEKEFSGDTEVLVSEAETEGETPPEHSEKKSSFRKDEELPEGRNGRVAEEDEIDEATPEIAEENSIFGKDEDSSDVTKAPVSQEDLTKIPGEKSPCGKDEELSEGTKVKVQQETKDETSPATAEERHQIGKGELCSNSSDMEENASEENMSEACLAEQFSIACTEENIEKAKSGKEVEMEQLGVDVEMEEPDEKVEMAELNGKVEMAELDGKVEMDEPNGKIEMTQPDGMVEMQRPGEKVEMEEPEGKVEIEGLDGKVDGEEPEVNVEMKKSDGKVEREEADGKVEREEVDGKVEKDLPDGKVKRGEPEIEVEIKQKKINIEESETKANVEKEKPEVIIEFLQPESTVRSPVPEARAGNQDNRVKNASKHFEEDKIEQQHQVGVMKPAVIPRGTELEGEQEAQSKEVSRRMEDSVGSPEDLNSCMDIEQGAEARNKKRKRGESNTSCDELDVKRRLIDEN